MCMKAMSPVNLGNFKRARSFRNNAAPKHESAAIPNDPDLNATFPRLYVRRKNSISSAQRERVGTLIKPEGGLSFVTLFFLHMKRSDVAASLSPENSVCWLNVDGDKNKMPPVCSDVLIHTVTVFPCTLESPL